MDSASKFFLLVSPPTAQYNTRAFDWFKGTFLKQTKKVTKTYLRYKTLGEQCVCGV